MPSHPCRTDKHAINRELSTCLPEVYFCPRPSSEDLVRSRYELYRSKTCPGRDVHLLEPTKQKVTWRRNGAAEAAVKVTKRALQSLGRGEGLTFSEFLMVANERPIDARVQSREDCIQYITLNTVLLGWATQSGDFRAFDYTTYPFKRLLEMQTQVSHFWKSWSQLAGPHLFIRSKWHTVAIRDIVWLCDQNVLRGQFKLARVVNVNADFKGIIRDVHVKVSQSGCAQVKTLEPVATESRYHTASGRVAPHHPHSCRGSIQLAWEVRSFPVTPCKDRVRGIVAICREVCLRASACDDSLASCHFIFVCLKVFHLPWTGQINWRLSEILSLVKSFLFQVWEAMMF